MDESTRALMRKEKDELNVYAGSHIGLFVSWFTYYSAVNAVGMGWLATRQVSNHSFVSIISIFFQFASALAILGGVVVLRYFKQLCRRESAIVAGLNEAGTNTTIPERTYEMIVLLLTFGCIAVFVAWVFFYLYAPVT